VNFKHNQVDDLHTVYQGKASLLALKKMIEGERYAQTTFFILTDSACKQHCLPTLMLRVPLLSGAKLIEIESSEEQKTMDACIRIWQKLAACFADRNTVLVNLGGGIVGDIGGFAASTYKRGIDFINIPTTLLAQVDASVGGKTGVNFLGYKNLIGSFQTPLGIFVFPEFLETLPQRQILCGLAEVIKVGLIADRAYWECIQQTSITQVKEVELLVERAIAIKQEIVIQDPKEKGIRKLLNFGHTIGHAIESCSQEEEEPLLHGEAIVIGMVCESYLSYKFAGLKHDALDEICSYLLDIYPAYEIRSDRYHRLIELMKNDKKNDGNRFQFTLLKELGVGVYDQHIELDDVVKSFQFYNEKAALMTNFS
jgi:3-dehydroquinate synthase